MAFDSKRLRVQLPCGQSTVVPPDGPGQICKAGTQCAGISVCLTHFSCGETFHCDGATKCFESKNCGETFHCNGTVAQPINPPLAIDADHLPLLRAELEAQLAEVDAAQRAVDDHRGEQ